MSVFADASAVVKLYADEAGGAMVRALGAMYVSQLSRVEVPAALWRKSRLGELAAESAGILVAAFESDYLSDDGPLAPVVVSGPVLDQAASLAAAHGLRAYDAVQLAGAMAARTADPECGAMAVFDRDLRAAAAKEGFALLP